MGGYSNSSKMLISKRHLRQLFLFHLCLIVPRKYSFVYNSLKRYTTLSSFGVGSFTFVCRGFACRRFVRRDFRAVVLCVTVWSWWFACRCFVCRGLWVAVFCVALLFIAVVERRGIHASHFISDFVSRGFAYRFSMWLFLPGAVFLMSMFFVCRGFCISLYCELRF